MRISDWSSDVCSSDLPRSNRQLCQLWSNRKPPRRSLAPADSHGNLPVPRAPVQPPLARSDIDSRPPRTAPENEGRRFMLKPLLLAAEAFAAAVALPASAQSSEEIGRATCRDRACQYV